MKLSGRSAARRRAIIAVSAALAVGVGSLAAPAQAAPGTGTVTANVVEDCPTPVPTGDIVPGLVGEGLTVVKGGTPQPFQVEVLGVLTDGIGAGRDLVMIEVSDLSGQQVIGDNGIWAGMSGSPVYVGGQLLGAISYGFTDSASNIGGLTPATDMMKLLAVSGASAAKKEAATARTKVTLTANQRKTLSARADAAVPGTALRQLRTPLSVSGLNAKRLTSLQNTFDGAGRSVITYAGGRATAVGKADVSAPQPGGNFAAVMSYGDVTIGGVGTTTAICGDQALAFGHPMDFAGQVTYGANDATSLAIVKDNSFGSFKMANIGGSFGTVDQDRLAAIRATLGSGPVTAPVTSTITNLDNGATRTGTTQVAQPDYLALATAYGLWANYDSTFDKIGKGLATSQWTITGTRAGGAPFSLSRSNTWSDLYDPTAAPAIEAADAVDTLVSNEFEPVTITGVTFDSKISSDYEQLRITKMAVSVNGGKYTSAKTVKVKPKSTLKVRVTMRGYQSSTDQNVVLTMKVAKRYAGQVGGLSVQGGLDAASGDGLDVDEDTSCLLTSCDEPEGSLNSVMSDITSVPRNDQVLADLDFGDSQSNAPSVEATSTQAAPVSGGKSITIKVTKK